MLGVILDSRLYRHLFDLEVSARGWDVLQGGLMGAGAGLADYEIAKYVPSDDDMLMQADGGYYSGEGDQKILKWMGLLHEQNPEEYSFIGHTDEGDFYTAVDENLNGTLGKMSPSEMGAEIASGKFGYRGQKDLRFYSCKFGAVNADGSVGAELLSKQLPNKIIWAANGTVIEVRATVVDGGWLQFGNGHVY